MANTAMAPVGDGAEEVAYKLFLHVAEAEGIDLKGGAGKKADRKWIFSTYAECIWVVRTADADW